MGNRVTRYNFWAWQYTVRNPTFNERVSRTIEFVESMRREGLITNTFTVKDIANERDKKGILLGGPVKSGRIPREATADETLWAREILTYYEYFVGLNYQYDDLQFPPTLGHEIVKNLDNYLGSYQFPIKQMDVSPWPFTGPRFITDCHVPCPGLFKTKVVKHLEGKTAGDCLVEINFNSPLNVILAEVELLYHYENMSETDSYSQAYEDCYKRMLKAKGETLGNNDSPRIIGLWLWDYCKTTGERNELAAVNVMLHQLGTLQGNGALCSLSYDGTEPRTFLRHLAKTKTCIEACEVLPMR